MSTSKAIAALSETLRGIVADQTQEIESMQRALDALLGELKGRDCPQCAGLYSRFREYHMA